MKASTFETTLSLIIRTGGVDVVIATDDTFESNATSGDMAMSAALAGLNGEELSPWDLSRPMREALASLAIEWPNTADVYADEECPVTLRFSGIVRAA